MLATRFPPRQVVLGAWLAFLAQTLVAVVAGSLLSLLPSQPVRIAAGLGFLVFAFMAARRDVDEEEREEEEAVASQRPSNRPAWIVSFLMVFAAEWGDLTQLATAALVAQTGQPLPVAVGAIAALWSVSLLAVVAGSQLGRYVHPKFLKWASVAVFAAVGLLVLLSAITGS